MELDGTIEQIIKIVKHEINWYKSLWGNSDEETMFNEDTLRERLKTLLEGQDDDETLPEKCPKCNQRLEYKDFAEPVTSVDCYEAICPNGHKWNISHEREDNSITISSGGFLNGK